MIYVITFLCIAVSSLCPVIHAMHTYPETSTCTHYQTKCTSKEYPKMLSTYILANQALRISYNFKKILALLAKTLPYQNTYINTLTLDAMAYVQSEKGLIYNTKSLKSLWKPLRNTLSKETLNNLLTTLMAQDTSKRDYYLRGRFLLAALIIASANPNQARKHDLLRPLGQAVLHNDAQAVALLLEYGANPNDIVTQELQAPLVWYAPSLAIIKLLITHGAKLPIMGRLSGCDQEHYEQLTQLFNEHTPH